MKMKDICVIGGGPAGMMAAIQAAENNHRVSLIEKNKSLGRKLFITGKGRCNLTNDRPIEDFFPQVLRNRSFLYSAFYSFDNLALKDFFESRGLKLKTERGDRVFPASEKSGDVIKVLDKELRRLNVQVKLKTEVTGLKLEGRTLQSLQTNQGVISADHYIFAAGGASYPLTGSDGKVFQLLKDKGIPGIAFRGSLIPLKVREDVSHLAGVSLKNVGFSLHAGGKEIFRDLGEMLFTHDGLSGPLVLSASGHAQAFPLKAKIDLKPGLSLDKLDDRILRDFQENQSKNLANGLEKLLIRRLIQPVLSQAGVAGDIKVHSVTRQQRRQLIETIKGLTYEVTGTRPLAEAIISRGGIQVKAIDPATMKLHAWDNVSVCGEIIDVDAVTGGYNLQIAFSTGYLAGGKL